MAKKSTEYYQEVGKEFCRLVEIINRLRDPDGCPWDKVQTHKSIRNCVLEEAYELVEGIDAESIPMMREECGDVLLQSVFNAVIAEDEGEFSVTDMLRELNEKLIFRHTHIFAGDKAYSAEEALKVWEKNKTKEKHHNGVLDKLDSVPKTFDPLLKADKVQKYAKKIGFEFDSVDDALDKLKEEIEEYKNATTLEQKEDEGGDVLFSVVNVLRMDGISSEVALNASTRKFETRFRKMVDLIRRDGKDETALTVLEQEEYYQRAKRILNENQ